jgi:VirE-like protein
MNSIQVSWVANATSTEARHCEVVEIINAIRAGFRQRAEIEQIRKRFKAEIAEHGDLRKTKQAIDDLKKALRGIMWSGTFSDRKAPADKKLIRHSGLLQADCDSLGARLLEVRKKLLKSSHLFALFVSPSGDGLKAIFRVPADAKKHPASFRAVEKHVLELIGVQIDQSRKDLAGMCFMSYDPELYYNPNATEIEPLPEPEKPLWNRPNGAVNLSGRQRIATELLGRIEWQVETSGYLPCPGKHLHTTGHGERDCRIELDNVPTVYCFHNSCRGILAGINHELRSRIAKAKSGGRRGCPRLC